MQHVLFEYLNLNTFENMKKLLVLFVAMLMGVNSASAEWWEDIDRGVFNHVGLNASIGTEGVGVGVAAPITDYMELGVGVNFLPKFKVKGDADIEFNLPATYNELFPTKDHVTITGDFSRTIMDVKLSVYPFGDRSSFFVAGGLSFGGEKIAKISGHSDLVESVLKVDPELKDLFTAELDKYDVKFDENGTISGDIRVKKLRPYVGLGFGRLVPQHRVSCRFEMGCQFMGKMKIYQSDKEVKIDDLNDADDDLSKVINRLKVYPVLKFTITGRIF